MKDLSVVLSSDKINSEILMGNYVIVRAMLEAGVNVVTSYPGSPTPEIADAISLIKDKYDDFYFEFSVNEKVATEVAFGASVNGYLSCVFFKSVGLNVAADSFVQLSLLELIGGMVIILGDDPGANSSQNEQDNRHYARLSYMPIFEPSNPAELYPMFKEACRKSQEMKMPVIFRLSTHICHAKQRISFDKYTRILKDKVSKFRPENGPYIPITSSVFPMKRKALQKLSQFALYSENSRFNYVVDNNSEYGIITSGLTYLSVEDFLHNQKNKPDILKLGITYPLPEQMICKYLKKHKFIKILEELDDFHEQLIKTIAFNNKISTTILGKQEIEDRIGEYSPDKVESILLNTWPDLFNCSPKYSIEKIENPIPRPAQLCPGCGHRSAFYAIKQALQKDDISVADIGCHTLGFLPPYNLGQALLSMGHSNGTAAGLSIFNDERKVVSFLGDSTFYHAGIPGIINAVYNNHKHTLIILENGTTAMTGHQEHPATGKNFNSDTQKIPLRNVLEGIGVKSIREIDTYAQSKLTQAVKDAMAEDNFSVVIAKHPCMLKFVRSVRRAKKALPKPVVIIAKCNKKYKCISEFACPSYQIDENGQVWVQTDLCIGDGSCKQTCPSDAIESQKIGDNND
jgi:indolepyruvate ferredoxin oxidoreductase alpha subunit